MNRSKYFKIALLILTFAVVQRSQLGTLSIQGIHPDFLLAATAVFGLLEGRESGAIIGFMFGLLADSFSSVPFGISSLVYTVVGYVAGMIEVTSLPESRVLETIIAAASSAGGVILLDVVLRLLGEQSVLDHLLVRAIVVYAVLGALLSLFAIPAFRWFLRLGLEERPPSRRSARY